MWIIRGASGEQQLGISPHKMPQWSETDWPFEIHPIALTKQPLNRGLLRFKSQNQRFVDSWSMSVPDDSVKAFSIRCLSRKVRWRGWVADTGQWETPDWGEEWTVFKSKGAKKLGEHANIDMTNERKAIWAAEKEWKLLKVEAKKKKRATEKGHQNSDKSGATGATIPRACHLGRTHARRVVRNGRGWRGHLFLLNDHHG